MKLEDKLIVALDVDNLERAEYFVDILYPKVRLFKIGSQLFTACGPRAVELVAKKGAQVFLDLKWYDIPQTVISSVTSGTGLSCALASVQSPDSETIKQQTSLPVFMMTVHASGTKEMMRAAVFAAQQKAEALHKKRPYIVGVTVLTSTQPDAKTVGMVLERALLAKDAGLDGIVCSVHETAAVRDACGERFIIVNPGIRPKGANAGGQKRVATAKAAFQAGADYIVVGRPVLEAKNPLLALNGILRD